MPVTTTTRLTPQQYLAIERAAEFRSEFCDGRMTLMPRTNVWHSRTKANLIGQIGSRLKGSRWHTLSTDMRIKVRRTESYFYPDIIIVHDGVSAEDDEQDTLLDPPVIIELLSDASEAYDRGKKFRRYRQVEGLREYVVVALDEPVLDRFVRQPDDAWTLTTFEGLGGEFAFASVPVRIPMADIYADVVFPPADEPK